MSKVRKFLHEIKNRRNVNMSNAEIKSFLESFSSDIFEEEWIFPISTEQNTWYAVSKNEDFEYKFYKANPDTYEFNLINKNEFLSKIRCVLREDIVEVIEETLHEEIVEVQYEKL